MTVRNLKEQNLGFSFSVLKIVFPFLNFWNFWMIACWLSVVAEELNSGFVNMLL